MLGECTDAIPPKELGDDSYYGYVTRGKGKAEVGRVRGALAVMEQASMRSLDRGARVCSMHSGAWKVFVGTSRS